MTPLTNYLPFLGESTLSINNSTKDWAGNWYKFVGGQGKLRLEFQADPQNNFTVFYIIEDKNGNVALNTLKLDQNSRAMIEVPDFGSNNVSLTIIPITRNKISDFSKTELIRSFFLSASTVNSGQAITEPLKESQNQSKTKEALIAELKAKILAIQLEIVRLLQQLIQLLQAQLRA